MKNTLLLFTLSFALTATLGDAQEAPASSQGTLEKLVILSRHGVRTPLSPPKTLESWVRDRTWPADGDNSQGWHGTPRGELTGPGAALAVIMGNWYAQRLGWANASSAFCPPAASVFLRADVDQRTVATSLAISRGLAPGCGLETHVAAPTPDPLFNPIGGKVCSLNAETAHKAVLQRLNNDPGSLDRQYKSQIEGMQKALNCCQPSICPKEKPQCELPDLVTKITVNPARGAGKGVGGSGSIQMAGAIGISSTASGAFLLEYANGMNWDEVGFGAVNSTANLAFLMELHNAQFEYMERTEYLARRKGSMLVNAVLQALSGTRIDSPVAGPMPPPEARFVAFVGHDTNIANVGAALGLSWPASADLPDKTAPAGALMFEVRNRGGERLVYAYYVAQTPEQMHKQTPLGGAVQPNLIALRMQCSRGASDYGCGLSAFQKLAADALDKECVKP